MLFRARAALKVALAAFAQATKEGRAHERE